MLRNDVVLPKPTSQQWIPMHVLIRRARKKCYKMHRKLILLAFSLYPAAVSIILQNCFFWQIHKVDCGNKFVIKSWQVKTERCSVAGFPLVLLIDGQPVTHSSGSQQQQSLGSYITIMFLLINSSFFLQSVSQFSAMLFVFRTQKRTATIMNILTMRTRITRNQPQMLRQPHKKSR